MQAALPELKTVRAFDHVVLRIPHDWTCGRDPEMEAYWSAIPEGSDEGPKLWITWEGYKTSSEVNREPIFGKIVEEMAQDVVERDSTSTNSELTASPNGYMAYVETSSIDDGEHLHFWWYRFFETYGNHLIMTFINFVIPEKDIAAAESQALRDTLDHEIRNATLGNPFDIVPPFGAHRPINFADQVRLDLPDNFTAESTGKGEWFGWFKSRGDIDIRARLWVVTEDKLIYDDDGVPMTAPDDMIEEAVAIWTGGPADGRRFNKFPNGRIAYDTHTDVGERDPIPCDDVPNASAWREQPQQCHVWRRFQFETGHLRIAELKLILPLDGKDEPPLPELVALIDASVQGADFPDFGTEDAP